MRGGSRPELIVLGNAFTVSLEGRWTYYAMRLYPLICLTLSRIEFNGGTSESTTTRVLPPLLASLKILLNFLHSLGFDVLHGSNELIMDPSQGANRYSIEEMTFSTTVADASSCFCLIMKAHKDVVFSSVS